MAPGQGGMFHVFALQHSNFFCEFVSAYAFFLVI